MLTFEAPGRRRRQRNREAASTASLRAARSFGAGGGPVLLGGALEPSARPTYIDEPLDDHSFLGAGKVRPKVAGTVLGCNEMVAGRRSGNGLRPGAISAWCRGSRRARARGEVLGTTEK